MRPPSRIAKRKPSSIAIGAINSTLMVTFSPGITISTPSSNVTAPVTVTINDGGVESEVTTDSNGHYSYMNYGSGRGDVVITASIYGSNDSVDIEDVIGYLSLQNNVEKLEYKKHYGQVDLLNMGWKFSASSSNNRFAIGLRPYDFDHRYEIRFRINI